MRETSAGPPPRAWKAQPVHGAPAAVAPAIELVHRGAQRLARHLVPGAAAEEVWVGLLPELQQVRVEAPRRGGHRGESEQRLGPPALRVGLIADRRLGHQAGEVDDEHLVTRTPPRSRGRAGNPSRAGPRPRGRRRPPGRAAAARFRPGDRVEVVLDAAEVVERAFPLRQQLIDPGRPVAVEVLARDVGGVVVRARRRCWRSRSSRPAGSRPRAARRRARRPSHSCSRSSPAWEVGTPRRSGSLPTSL